ncbi:hypothetical protein MRB53_028542 [Persea americana]|uniref:Uncharacterized protein n=1 Tax=Persea americana TaxID=3435 RepID=A0ACC2KG97_PERAE|nr:hypothetical protein MRB53_028542 [Persea americana]
MGMFFSITEDDIAHALGCRTNAGGFSRFPATSTVASITNEMCGGRFSKDNYTSTRRSYLPQKLWLIDQVLRANAFPTHHKDKRRGEFLETLYAIHSGYAVSLPHMDFQEMCKVNRLFKESKKDPKKKRPLPFPHLLPMLFLHLADPTDVPLSISPNEEPISCSDLYSEVHWTQGVTSILCNLQHAHPAMMPGVVAPLVDPPVHPQAPPVVPPPVAPPLAGPTDPFSMSYAQYEALLHDQQALQSRQLAFESRFKDFATTTTYSLFEMRSLLRGLSGLSPPHRDSHMGQGSGRTSHDRAGEAD